MILCVILLAWAVMLLSPVSRRPLSIGLVRLAQPWQSRLPDSLADLTAQPGNVNLLEGDTLSIDATTPAQRATLVVQPDAAPRSMQLLRPTSPAHWNGSIADVRESFRYRILTDRDDTPWFRATVTRRPAIQSLTVHYAFPAYTGLPAKSVTSLEAFIDGLAGTTVTLSVHTSEPIHLQSSRLIVATDAVPQSIPFTHSESDNEYQTTFTLDHDATYSLDLINAAGVHSRSQPPRRIIARPDRIPTIVIQSPDPQITARPDDTIPIQFIAADDFGVTKIEAQVRIDDGPSLTLSIPFDRSDSSHIAGPDFDLDLDSLLASASPETAHQIDYHLIVTDTRAPNPQSSASSSQRIAIDPAQPRSFQGQLDLTLAKTLTAVITGTIEELDRARPRLVQAKSRDASEPLGEWQRRELHQAAHDLPAIAIRLARSAAQPTDATFVPITRALSAIADGPLRAAAEQSARADLNADDWQQRNDAITQSVTGITQAREQLQKLLDSNLIEQRRGQAEAARDLDAAKNLQRTALDSLQRNDPAKAADLQARAAVRLRQAMTESPSLRDPASQRLAENLQSLIRDLSAGRQISKEQLAQIRQQLKSFDATPLGDRARKAGAVLDRVDLPNASEALKNAQRILRAAEELQSPSTSNPALDAQQAAQAQQDPPSAESSSQAAAALSRAASTMNLALTAPTSNDEGPRPAAQLSAIASGATNRGSTTGPLPASIRDLGISPEQWLRLSPAVQRDVLSTARQSGPLSYRQLIADYYLKVSQMQSHWERPAR